MTVDDLGYRGFCDGWAVHSACMHCYIKTHRIDSNTETVTALTPHTQYNIHTFNACTRKRHWSDPSDPQTPSSPSTHPFHPRSS